jgi:hypothetical protein
MTSSYLTAALAQEHTADLLRQAARHRTARAARTKGPLRHASNGAFCWLRPRAVRTA